MKEFQWYCPKCGLKSFLLESDIGICVCCRTQMMETPHEYGLTEENMCNDYQLFQQQEQRLFDEVISKSPEFDINLYNNKDSIFQQRQQQQEESIAHGKAILEEQNRIPKCPTCQSTNIRKIGALESGASILTFGIFSKKINKSFKCSNCGYTW